MTRQWLLAGMLIVSFHGISAESAAHWSYEGDEGPPEWGSLAPAYSLCDTGKNQSPINIVNALETDQDAIALNFQQTDQQIFNNGHTIQVNVDDGNTLTLNKENFTLQQFHFHSPGENQINGETYPMEGHFVYKNSDDDLAVVAVMFEEGEANPQLTPAWEEMPTEPGQPTALSEPVDIEKLMLQYSDFYHFNGSLTTPPCSEGVRWVVLPDPVSASAEQIDQFEEVMRHDNNRPVQPLNGRVIVY